MTILAMLKVLSHIPIPYFWFENETAAFTDGLQSLIKYPTCTSGGQTSDQEIAGISPSGGAASFIFQH